MYSFDKVNTKWSDLADEYVSMLDELNSDVENDEDTFISVSEFDEY